MSNFLKQSTSVVISFGPFLDKTDGVTEETGLVSALDHASTGIKLSKNGGALTIRHATVTTTTYDAYGMYRVTLDTTDTNSLGTLRVAFNEAATCLPVWQDFMVLPANIYDSLVGGSDLLDVSVTQILGTAVSTPATAGVLDVNVKNAGNTAWASGAIVAGAIATGAITNAKFAAGAIDAAAIADNAIDAGSIAANAITSAKIATDAIGAAQIATGAITNAKFAAGAIDAAAIADNAIDNATFAADVGSTAYATNKIALAADKAIANAALATAANLAAAKSVVDNIETKLGLPDITIADDIAGVKAETALIKAKTDNLPAAPAAVGDIPTAVANAAQVRTNLTTELGRIDAAISSRSTYAGGDTAGVTTLLSRIASALTITTGKVDVNDKTGFSLSGAGVQAIWDALTSALTVVGSIGKRLSDYVDAAISSRSTYAGGDTSGVTTLLSRIVGTLAAGTHNAQTGDSFARIGAAGAGLTALGDTRLANLDATVSSRLAAASYTAPPSAAANASQVRTELTTELGRIDVAVSTRLATAGYTVPPTVGEIADANWDEALSGHLTAGTTGKALSDASAAGTPLDAAGVRAAVGLATNNLDAQLASIPAAASAATWGDTRADYTVVGTFGEVMNGAGGQLAADVAAVKADTEAIKAKTDNLPAEPASRTNITSAAGVAVTSIANNVVTAAVLDASAVAEFAARLLDGENLDTGLTVRHGLELAAGGILNKLTGAGTGIEKVRNFSDTDDLASVTLDINGNKTAVAYNFSI